MENVSSTLGFIYIIQEREFINARLNIYKIGYSESIARRLPQYPKESELKFCVQTRNFVAFERAVIKRFDVQFKLRSDIGREYYEGDLCDMIISIASMVREHNETGVEDNNVVNVVTDEADNVAKSEEIECQQKEKKIRGFLRHYIETVGVSNEPKEYSITDFYKFFKNWKGETLVVKLIFFREYIAKIGRWNGIFSIMKDRREIYMIQTETLKGWLDFEDKIDEF